MKTYNDVVNQLIQTNDDLINDKITIEKARQIAQNVQVLINAAKITLEHMKLTGQLNSKFFENSTQLLNKKFDKSCANCKSCNNCDLNGMKCKKEIKEFFEPLAF